MAVYVCRVCGWVYDEDRQGSGGNAPVRSFDGSLTVAAYRNAAVPSGDGLTVAATPRSAADPGTKFGDLPDDFTCPVCGVGKGMFSKA